MRYRINKRTGDRISEIGMGSAYIPETPLAETWAQTQVPRVEMPERMTLLENPPQNPLSTQTPKAIHSPSTTST